MRRYPASILLCLYALLSLYAMPALAEDKLIVAKCGVNTGCTCALSNVTATEAAIILGAEPPPGKGEAKLLEYDGQMMWTRYSLRELSIIAGGNDECPLQLFPDEAIVPQDGVWLGTASPTASRGCPPGLDAMLAPMVSGMVVSRDMKWGGTFDPDKMRDQTSPKAIRWTEVTPRSYRGEPANLPTKTASASIAVDFQATLITPKIVRGVVRMQLRSQGGPGSEQVLKMAGLANCRAVVRYEFRRQGP